MKDSGIVVSKEKSLARVEVECLSSCHDCSAHSLCVGHTQSKGVILARNPVDAAEGDHVTIEVPEARYTRSLIILFGGLLVLILLGMGLGSILSPALSLRGEGGSIAGFFIALFAGAGLMARYLRNENKRNLYPVILEITQEGACHGQT